MNRLDAYKTYLFMGAASSLFERMIFTVLAVYYVQRVGMNALQLVLVGTTIELTILVFEIPTGVVADLYSRRASIIAGFALIGLCYVVQGFVPLFAVILLAEFIRGVGETFLSGAYNAWIADEIGEQQLGRAFLRHNQARQIGGLAGIALGAGLATLHLNLPIYLGGAALVGLSLFLALAMPEAGFAPAPRSERTTWRVLFAITREGIDVVRQRPVVRMFFLASLITGIFSEGFDRLWEAHFLQSTGFPTVFSLQPVVWIGIVRGVAMVLGIAAAEVLVRRLNMGNDRAVGRALLVSTAGLSLAVIAFGLAPTFVPAALAFWAAGLLRSLQDPIANTWLNRHIQPRVRATVLSIVGQSNAFGQIAGGPVVGVVGLRSLRAAMVFAGLLLTPAVGLYRQGIRRTEAAPKAKPAAEDMA